MFDFCLTLLTLTHLCTDFVLVVLHFCQTPDLDQDLSLGVDFVLPLEQQQSLTKIIPFGREKNFSTKKKFGPNRAYTS